MKNNDMVEYKESFISKIKRFLSSCLLYTSDAADEL
mgnify:CR=1 FL=1